MAGVAHNGKPKPNHRMRDLRGRRRLTQSELAERAGLSVATINQIEKGRRRATVISEDRIARALRVPREELFPPEEDPAA